MRYIQCPEEYFGNEKSLFLAGGISDCEDWQSDLSNMLNDEELIIINPRRKKYNIHDLDLERQQIKWEYDHIDRSKAVSFWFPSNTVCPITLYELGKCTSYLKKLFVGMDPKYIKRENIEIQIEEARPEIEIVYSLNDLAEQIKIWSRKN